MKIILYFSLLFCLCSCEKLLIEPNPSNTNEAVFEQLWKEINGKYCYFKIKNVDWNVIHDKYKAKVNNQQNASTFFNILAQMLNELKDGHVNLHIPNTNVTYSYYTNQGLFNGYAHNFSDSVLTKGYLKTGCGTKVRTAILANNIGYLYYGSFATDLSSDDWDALIKSFSHTNGLIIDIRDNGGGSVENIRLLVRYFIEHSTTIGYTYSKQSADPNDFSTYIPVTVAPSSIYYPNKVMLLVNRHTFSAANMFTAAMKDLPQVTLIGDKTGGGGAGPIGGELLNGWLYRFSAMAFCNSQKQDIEVGIDPDIRVDMTTNDMAHDIDTIVEKALANLSR